MKNHRCKIIALVAGLCLGIIGAALAAPTTKTIVPGEQPYGDIQGLAPKKAGDVCVTTTIHHAADTIAVFNLFTSNRWYSKTEWKVVKATDGTAFPVERRLGNNTTGPVSSSGEMVINREYTTYTLKPFGNNTSAVLRACQSRN